MKHEFLDSNIGLSITFSLEVFYIFSVVHMLLDLLHQDFYSIYILLLFMLGLFVSLYGKMLKVSRGRLFSTGRASIDIKNSMIYYAGFSLVMISFILHLF
ncbi:hypothetical protein [Bacteriovorax sp. Seq25_V]|uniref:hypothetical protein n=1 Tax=Bacteriovorax sp. Seq25_V TaxID=1201288 RepID=UPI00054E3F7E|nr:hypothetical protein [Bacteriovorax sp. Seq25_V]